MGARGGGLLFRPGAGGSLNRGGTCATLSLADFYEIFCVRHAQLAKTSIKICKRCGGASITTGGHFEI